jgi:hypothetical protein
MDSDVHATDNQACFSLLSPCLIASTVKSISGIIITEAILRKTYKVSVVGNDALCKYLDHSIVFMPFARWRHRVNIAGQKSMCKDIHLQLLSFGFSNYMKVICILSLALS